MSRLRFLSLSLLATGLMLVLASPPPPAEAGPHDRQDRSRSLQHHQKQSDAHGGQQDRGRHLDSGHDRQLRHGDGHHDHGHEGYRAPRYRPLPHPGCAPRPGCGNELRIVSTRPWWEGAPRVYVHGTPFFFHAGLGVYLGGVGLSLGIGDCSPAGYVYVDPYCGTRFDSLEYYAVHARFQGHSPVVEVVAL